MKNSASSGSPKRSAAWAAAKKAGLAAAAWIREAESEPAKSIRRRLMLARYQGKPLTPSLANRWISRYLNADARRAIPKEFLADIGRLAEYQRRAEKKLKAQGRGKTKAANHRSRLMDEVKPKMEAWHKAGGVQGELNRRSMSARLMASKLATAGGPFPGESEDTLRGWITEIWDGAKPRL